MAPSQVQIATGVLQRLVKEEQSYYKEMDQQKARISKIEKGEGDDAENKDFQLQQEVRAIDPMPLQDWQSWEVLLIGKSD